VHTNETNSLMATGLRPLLPSNAVRSFVDNRDLPFNGALNESSYDDYYEYDEDETTDKTDLVEYNDYLDDYAESFNVINNGSKPTRKPGICPKMVDVTGQCDQTQSMQADCRLDTDCPEETKCCAAACGRRSCKVSAQGQ
jgi:hypothetical protein